MKRIFEYKIFDIMKDDENRAFLNRVKDENPDLYSRFMSLVGNKGLKYAQKKYQWHDPKFQIEYQKQKKIENREKVKKGRLEVFKNEINLLKKTLDNSELKGYVLYFMKDDSNISKFFKNSGVKKKYQSFFTKIIKSSKMPVLLNSMTKIEKIEFFSFSDDWDGDRKRIITISHLFNAAKNIESYTTQFSFEEWFFHTDKNTKFKISRNKMINQKLSDYNLSLEELKETLTEFSYMLSNDFREDWEFRNDVNKYNL